MQGLGTLRKALIPIIFECPFLSTMSAEENWKARLFYGCSMQTGEDVL